MRRAAAIAAAALLGACGSFDDPAIVVDLRVLAISAEPPEQVVPFDPLDPPGEDDFDALGLVDVEVCALIADPDFERGLAWSMRVCARTETRRCDDPTRPGYEIARGRIEDPEAAGAAQAACGVLRAEPALALVIEDAVSIDDLAGAGGIDVMVDLEVVPDGAPEETIWGSKRVRFSPELPPERVANRNPSLDAVMVAPNGRDPRPLPLGRCADLERPIRVVVGDEVPLEPAEAPGTREEYVLPTIDGGSRTFTESPTYQWLATAGSWKRAETGGPRDITGMIPPLSTVWRPPAAEDVTEETRVSIWVIQRDERLGLAWYESCVVVVPAEE